MRSTWVLVVACSGSPARTPEALVDSPQPRITTDAALDAAPDPDDPDGDTIRGDCDLCPTEPETWNGILDEDGCPDSSGISHAVIHHPTNLYSLPIQVRYDGDKPSPQLSLQLDNAGFDDGIEAIEVIGRSRVDVKPRVASKRAATIADHVRRRVLQSVNVTERVTGAARVIVDDEIGVDADTDVVIVVMRARTVDIWKWHDDHLVRATPRARLPVPKLPPGCP